VLKYTQYYRTINQKLHNRLLRITSKACDYTAVHKSQHWGFTLQGMNSTMLMQHICNVTARSIH